MKTHENIFLFFFPAHSSFFRPAGEEIAAGLSSVYQGSTRDHTLKFRTFSHFSLDFHWTPKSTLITAPGNNNMESGEIFYLSATITSCQVFSPTTIIYHGVGVLTLYLYFFFYFLKPMSLHHLHHFNIAGVDVL